MRSSFRCRPIRCRMRAPSPEGCLLRAAGTGMQRSQAVSCSTTELSFAADPQLLQQLACPINLAQGLEDDRRMHGDRAIPLRIEPVGAGDRMDVAIEHEADES